VYLLWPFTSPEVTAGLVPKVAEIAVRHVGRIVYLSAQPAADQPGSFRALVERAIASVAVRALTEDGHALFCGCHVRGPRPVGGVMGDGHVRPRCDAVPERGHDLVRAR
jgi:hypothetical protein